MCGVNACTEVDMHMQTWGFEEMCPPGMVSPYQGLEDVEDVNGIQGSRHSSRS